MKCIDCFNFRRVLITEDNFDREKDNFENHKKLLRYKLRQLKKKQMGFYEGIKVWFCAGERKPIFSEEYAKKMEIKDCPTSKHKIDLPKYDFDNNSRT